MFDIPCVILAGGKSSRMGEDKSLLPFKGYDTLIEYQYSKLSKLFKDVYISSKNDKFDFLKDKEKLIFDDSDIYSPMVALRSIFNSLNSEMIFIITVDIPLIKSKTIEYIINKTNNNYEIIVAKDLKKTHNLCGVFSKKLLKFVDECLKNDIHKINHLVRSSNTLELFIDNKDEFINLNTKEEYNKSLLI